MILLKKNTSRFVYYDDGISLAFGSIQYVDYYLWFCLLRKFLIRNMLAFALVLH